MDTNPVRNEWNGSIILVGAMDESFIESYSICYGSSPDTILDTVACNVAYVKGGGVMQTLDPLPLPPPEGATHLIALSTTG